MLVRATDRPRCSCARVWTAAETLREIA